METPHRYVVLHHTGYGESHYDFMVEAEPGGPLLTWRIPEWPEVTDASAIEKLPDHRRDYLTYEGEISHNRGRVKRVESGECELITAGGKHASYALLFADKTSIHIGRARLKGKYAKHGGPWFIVGTRLPNARITATDLDWLPSKLRDRIQPDRSA